MVTTIGRYPRLSAAAVVIPTTVLAGTWLAGHSTALVGALVVLFAAAVVTAARPWLGTWMYLGVLVLSPNYVGVSLGALGDWTPTRALGVAVAIGLTYRSGVRLGAWNRLDCLFALYLLATTLPMAFKGATIVYTLKLLIWSALDYGVPYLVLRTAARDLVHARRVLLVCAFWASVVGLFAVAEVVTQSNPFSDLGPQLSVASLWSEGIYRADTLRAQVSFSHPISLGMYAALLLPLTLWLARWAERWQRALARVSVIAVSATLLATLSRGPWLGALAALILTIPLQPAHFRRASTITLGVVLLTGAAVYASGATPLTQIIGDSFNPATDAYGNIVYRQALADAVLPVWSQSPLIGYADYVADGAFPVSFSIDNHYLATLLVQGALGLIAFALVLGAALWACWRTAREQQLGNAERDLAASLGAALIGQLIVLGTVAMIGLGPQVFWGVIGLCAAPWCAQQAPRPYVAEGSLPARPRVRARTSAAV